MQVTLLATYGICVVHIWATLWIHISHHYVALRLPFGYILYGCCAFVIATLRVIVDGKAAKILRHFMSAAEILARIRVLSYQLCRSLLAFVK